jgi:hypothetical protein
MRLLPPRKRSPTWRELIVTCLAAVALVIPLRWLVDPGLYYGACVLALLGWAVVVRLMIAR